MMNGNRRTVLQGVAILAASSALPRVACAADAPADTSANAAKYTVVATNLGAPEGPKYLADGSILICEMAYGHLSRILPGGKVETIADLGGSPNGAAIGPDGAAYVVNDGGLKFTPTGNGGWTPAGPSPNYIGGLVQRVDLKTGASRTLYKEVNGNPLSSPNDMVFDRSGGIWFSDAGATKARSKDFGGIYWCKPDGSEIREVVFGLIGPNGITLSPDGKTLYLALTQQRQVLSYQVEAPGVLKKGADGKPEATIFAALLGPASFDSMSMEEDGTLAVCSPQQGKIFFYTPDGKIRDEIYMGENGVTNVTFGGADRKTLYITLTRSGRVVSLPWKRAGLKPFFT